MPPFPLPPLIGHRGARALAPENTLAGLRQAAALAVRWVEVDVRLTADGVPVILHDATLERTTDSQGRLAETPLEAVCRLDAGGWFGPAFAGEPVPTLRRYLEAALALDIRVNLELKCGSEHAPGNAAEAKAEAVALAETALSVARALWQPGAPGWGRPPPLISSFDQTCLMIAAQRAADWPRGLLLHGISADWAERADQIEAAAIIINHQSLTSPADVATLAVAGRPVLAYTVNEPVRARQLRTWGVSALFTDRPDETMAAAVAEVGAAKK